MTVKKKKIILGMVVATFAVLFIFHLLLYYYYLSIASDRPDPVSGQIVLITEHGSIGYITFRQNQYLYISEVAGAILVLVTILLGAHWKLIRMREKGSEQKYYEFNPKNVRADYVPRCFSEKRPYLGPHHNLLTLISLLCLITSLSTIGGRFLYEVDGRIISFKTIDDMGHRYIIQDRQGRYKYARPGSMLPAGLPLGTYIRKEKYKLSWEMDNNRIINNFPIRDYLILCAIGILFALWAFHQKRVNRLTAPRS